MYSSLPHQKSLGHRTFGILQNVPLSKIYRRKIIQYESGNENDDICMFQQSSIAWEWIVHWSIDFRVCITSMFTTLYYQIKPLHHCKIHRINLDDEIDENKGFQVVVSRCGKKNTLITKKGCMFWGMLVSFCEKTAFSIVCFTLLFDKLFFWLVFVFSMKICRDVRVSIKKLCFACDSQICCISVFSLFDTNRKRFVRRCFRWYQICLPLPRCTQSFWF